MLNKKTASSPKNQLHEAELSFSLISQTSATADNLNSHSGESSGGIIDGSVPLCVSISLDSETACTKAGLHLSGMKLSLNIFAS